MPNLLDDLDDEQRLAASTINGSVFFIAARDREDPDSRSPTRLRDHLRGDRSESPASEASASVNCFACTHLACRYFVIVHERLIVLETFSFIGRY